MRLVGILTVLVALGPFCALADVAKVINDGDKTYEVTATDFSYAGSTMYLVEVEDGGRFFGKGLLFIDHAKGKFKLTVFENKDFTAYTIEGDWRGSGPGSSGHLIYNTGKSFAVKIGAGAIDD